MGFWVVLGGTATTIGEPSYTVFNPHPMDNIDELLVAVLLSPVAFVMLE